MKIKIIKGMLIEYIK